MEISELNLSVRAANAVMRAGIKTVEELNNKLESDITALQRDIGLNSLTEVKAALLAYNNTAFDYTLVDEDTADFLKKATVKIANNLVTLMNSQAEIGAILVNAHEKLASHYNGCFEKWYTSLGMSKSTVYRFIQVHDFRENLVKSSQLGGLSENAAEIFDNLPKMLQADISSPSAPAEAVRAALSGDITTHKEFIEMKRQLEKLNKENAELEEQRDSLLEELQEERSKPQATVITDPKQSEEYKAVAAELKEANETMKRYDDALKDSTALIQKLKTQLGLHCPGLSLIVIPIDVLEEVKGEIERKTWRKLEKYVRFEGGTK